jgi:hypothetical protein
VECFGEFTLVEFKSPSDTLRAGDFQTFLAYVLLYRAQTDPMLEPDRLHLVVIAPKLTKPYREELRLFGITPQPQEPGIWRLEGMVVHHIWVLETEVLAGLNHPLLTLFSPMFLEKSQATYELMHQAGYTELMVYVAQQVHQFRRLGRDFAMQHAGTEAEMKRVLGDLLEVMTPEEQRAVVSRWPRDLRWALFEDLLRESSPEERERLRQLLQQPPPQEGDSARPK